jgi:hypothetical protein
MFDIFRHLWQKNSRVRRANEVDPMIEIEFRQEILNTGLDHWNTCNSKISDLLIKSNCV